MIKTALWYFSIGSFVVIVLFSTVLVMFLLPLGISEAYLSRVTIAFQIVLPAVLIWVTVVYTLQTKKIADATKGLAEQATLQRQSDFLPIIDIIHDPDPHELIKLGLLKDSGESPETLLCRLSNVGRGPAFDLKYQVKGMDRLFVEPTFLVGQIMNSVLGPKPETEITGQSRLEIKVESDIDGLRFIRVLYLDIFGNNLSSRKDLVEDAPNSLGPLTFDRAASKI